MKSFKLSLALIPLLMLTACSDSDDNDSKSIAPAVTQEVADKLPPKENTEEGSVKDSEVVETPVEEEVVIVEETTPIALSTYPIVDTNQVRCFNSTSGSEITCASNGTDAEHQGNQASYTLSDDGTVVNDNITGLMWSQSSDLDGDSTFTDYDDKLSQTDAVNYCSELSLGGYDDWRLPNAKTLYSLILFSGEDASDYQGTDTTNLVTFLDPSFAKAFGDQDAGDRIIDAQYATTSKYVSTTMNGDDTMFGVNFVDGRIKGYPTYSLKNQSDNKFYVLCVRGNESYGENDFIDNNDLTISDKATNLMWQKEDFQSSDFESAIDQCEAATTASQTDWRLPNSKELQSLVDYTRSADTTSSAAIDPIFDATSFTNEEGETEWGYYWTNTTHTTSSGTGSSAVYISFGRALGYFQNAILDVHGAGAQRSNEKQSEQPIGAKSTTDADAQTIYYKGPQGDILRIDNMVRCVRDLTN
jgi:hypothetical protein